MAPTRRITRHTASLIILSLLSQNAAASSPPPTFASSPNTPPGRLGRTQTPICPLPGHLGILPDLPSISVQWSHPPHCAAAAGNASDPAPRIDCLFTSSTFRAGHGTSLITSTTTMSNLISSSAFIDIPPPPRSPLLSPPAYTVVPIPDKGLGTITTRRVKRGEIIMVDLPAVLVSMEFLAGNKAHHRRRLMKRAMEQLPRETRERIERLARGGAKHEVDAIFGTNTNTVVMGDGGLAVGLFLGVARINHSCRPNAYYRFSPDRLTMEVVAHVAIEAGEEILLNYTPPGMKHEERRRFLQQNWGLDCTCSLCRASEADIADSEGRRRNIEELRETMIDARKNKFYKDAITIAGDWLFYCEEEGLAPVMVEYYDILADLYELNGDLENATRNARLALDGWVRFGSVDDAQLEHARETLVRLWEKEEAKSW